MKTDKFSAAVLIFGLYLAAAIVIALIFGHRFDGDFALYRSADHLHSGQGLVYGTPGPIVSTYPIAPLLLSVAATTGLSITIVADILLVISLALGGLFLARICGPNWIAGLIYVLIGAWLPSLSVAIAIAFGIAALDFARSNHWTLAGLLVALAILAHPLAIVLAVLMILLALRVPGALWRYVIPAALLPVLTLLLINLTYGSNVAFIAIMPSGLIIVLAIGAVLLLILRRNREDRFLTAVIAGWMSIAAATVLLSGHSLIFPTMTDFTPQIDAGKWLASHSDQSETVATEYTGALAYYADRPIIDFGGNVQDIPFDKDFFLKTAPDLIVLEKDQPVAWDAFQTTYANVYTSGNLIVYHRVVNFPAQINQPLDLVFSGGLLRSDLRLKAIAVTNTAHPGDLVRVRLDWQLAYAPSYEVTIKLTLLDVTGKAIVTAADKYPPAIWHAGTISTYHLLALPNNIPPGTFALHAAVSIRNGDLGDEKLTEINVTK